MTETSEPTGSAEGRGPASDPEPPSDDEQTSDAEPTSDDRAVSDVEPTAATSDDEPTWSGGAEATDLAARLSRADGLVVGLDFDGTLAPIAEDPDEVSIEPECLRAVTALAARPNATVAVISGRALDDLRPRVDAEEVVCVGNHGLEMERDGDVTVHPDAEALRPAVERACSAVEARVDDVPGCVVERKGPTATVHYRRTPPDRVKEVRAAVEAAAGDEDGLGLVSGKQSVEIRPDVDWDKGAAMRRLVEDAPDSWRAVYVGDDTTDEDVFRELEPDDVGVRVGDRPDTAAGFVLPGQDAVPAFLEWLDGVVSGWERPG